MSRQETVLSVFVASPGDVEEERNCLEDVIRDLNLAWARDQKIRLELVRWETHAFPGVGEDAQAVINDQIPDDYDIFIGIMWYRFGTPTGRAGSGTIEEFQRAKRRYDLNPRSLHLMIYFKDAPAPFPPSQLDLSQLAKVAEFRSALGTEGTLYWTFDDSGGFSQFVRLHLTRCVQEWRDRQNDSKPSTKTPRLASTYEIVSSGSDAPPTDDIGLIDLMEQFQDEFAILAEIIERIVTAITEVGDKMVLRAAETNAFNSSPDAKNPNSAKRIINKSATDLEQFVLRLEAEMPLFAHHLNAGMNALVAAAAIVVDFTVKGDDLEQLKENLTAVRALRETIGAANNQVIGFQNAVNSLPRLTTQLTRAKRQVANAVQKQIDEFRKAEVMAREAEATFASFVDRDDIPD